MRHSSTEPAHTLCSHDVSDCPFKKREKHPNNHRGGIVSFFFFLALVNLTIQSSFAVVLHILPPFEGRCFVGPRLFFSSNIKRATAWISTLEILFRTKNGHLLLPTKHFVLSWLFKCQLYSPQALQLHFHSLLSAYCNISRPMFSIPWKRLWAHREGTLLVHYTSTASKIWEEGSLNRILQSSYFQIAKQH